LNDGIATTNLVDPNGQPGDVVSGNCVIGRDTDPFIRDQLPREFNSARPD
jgi:hypothetical protein